MFTIIFTLVLVVSYVIFIFLKSFSIISHKPNKLPVHRVPPLLYLFVKFLLPQNQNFNIHVRMHQWIESINRMYDKERIVSIPVIGFTMVQIYKPEYLEAVLSSTTNISKSWMYKSLRPWLGDGLLLSTGNKWRARRKLLTPAFHFKMLENFISVFNSHSNVLIRKIKSLKSEEFVDIVRLMPLCTLDIIGEAAMGIQLNSQERQDSEYVKSISKVEKAITTRVIYPWLRPDFIFYLTPVGREYKAALKVIHNFTRQVISERRKEIEQELTRSKNINEEVENVYLQTKGRRPLLDLLLYHFMKGDLSEEDVREEVDTFMFGGHDTTGVGISWTIYNIGLYSDIQNKLYQELSSIFGDDTERCVTADDIRQMKYLECVIKETLRLYPPVPFISRATSDCVEINGISIPKNSVFAINTHSIHRDPELFKDPEVFRPERFFPENSLDRHPMAFIPFSAGPRNCIGQKFAMMEEKTVISNILRQFRVESLDPPDKVMECGEIVLRPLKGLRMRFVER